MIEGTIICNVGDMLQRLTDYALPSTTHRVENPKGDAAKSSCYSIPFYMHVNPDMSLDALPQYVTDENPKRDELITAKDYLIQYVFLSLLAHKCNRQAPLGKTSKINGQSVRLSVILFFTLNAFIYFN